MEKRRDMELLRQRKETVFGVKDATGAALPSCKGHWPVSTRPCAWGFLS